MPYYMAISVNAKFSSLNGELWRLEVFTSKLCKPHKGVTVCFVHAQKTNSIRDATACTYVPSKLLRPSYATWAHSVRWYVFLYFESIYSTFRQNNVLNRCERLLSRTTMLHKHAALGLFLWGTNLLPSPSSAWAAFCHFSNVFLFMTLMWKRAPLPLRKRALRYCGKMEDGRKSWNGGGGGWVDGWGGGGLKWYRVLMSNTWTILVFML